MLPLVLTILLLACASNQAGQRDENPLAALAPGWNQIAGGTGTGCALDTTFSFFVRLGDPKRVAVYLQGGGACWNGTNCDVNARPTFDPSIDTTDNPARLRGLADLENEANPIRGFSLVFIPYCTGDVHLGTRTVTYTSRETPARPARTYEIHHWGAKNVASALAWTYAHFRDPQLIFVGGGSAGAIPSPLHASQIALHYPRARVVQLGDGAGAYRDPGVGRSLVASGALDELRRVPGFQGLDSATFTFEELYARAARVAPRVTFAQFNNADDSTQVFFLRQLGQRDIRLPGLLAANLADIRRRNPAFRSFTAPGGAHTILGRPQFYTLTVDGVSLRDWVAALIEGKEIPSVGDGAPGGAGR